MSNTTCPSCGNEIIAGEDRCPHCLHSLMQVDLPAPADDDVFQNALMTAPVANILTGVDLLVANSDDSVAKVIKIFQDEGRKCILVYADKQLVGILSNRDLLRKVSFKGKDLEKMQVNEVMTPNPEYVTPEEPIAVAVNKMALGGFRNLPVLSGDGAPLSIITIKDVLAFLSHRKKQ